MNEILVSQLSSIEMLFLDVDGVLTNGEIIYGESGEALKRFNVKDGLGITMLQKTGVKVVIFTGRESKIVETRMRDLNVSPVFQGVKDKLAKAKEFLSKTSIELKNIAYIGDDVIDIELLEQVGFSACPSDAVSEVREICTYICEKEGGQGAVRELIDMILSAKKELS